IAQKAFVRFVVEHYFAYERKYRPIILFLKILYKRMAYRRMLQGACEEVEWLKKQKILVYLGKPGCSKLLQRTLGADKELGIFIKTSIETLRQLRSNMERSFSSLDGYETSSLTFKLQQNLETQQGGGGSMLVTNELYSLQPQRLKINKQETCRFYFATNQQYNCFTIQLLRYITKALKFSTFPIKEEKKTWKISPGNRSTNPDNSDNSHSDTEDKESFMSDFVARTQSPKYLQIFRSIMIAFVLTRGVTYSVSANDITVLWVRRMVTREVRTPHKYEDIEKFLSTSNLLAVLFNFAEATTELGFGEYSCYFISVSGFVFLRNNLKVPVILQYIVAGYRRTTQKFRNHLLYISCEEYIEKRDMRNIAYVRIPLLLNSAEKRNPEATTRCAFVHHSALCAIVSTEQRTNNNFCVLLHKTTAETLTLLEEAYAEEAMKKIQVYVLHKRFSGGHDSIKDNCN
ncbi:hypothetical protein C0J52_27055, partial [Blattella germanica]